MDFTVKSHENECMNWDGSLNHFTVEELEQSDTDDDEDTDDNEEFIELEGDELLQSLQCVTVSTLELNLGLMVQPAELESILFLCYVCVVG